MTMPLSTKSSIQKIVKDALKLPYRNKEVSKDQYTEINRNVSRMLYEIVGEVTDLGGEVVNTLRETAGKEVTKAIESLRTVTA